MFHLEVTWSDGSYLSLKFKIFNDVLGVSNDDIKYFSVFQAPRMERSMCGTQRVV